MKFCSVPGCIRKHNARGWCGPHYAMWRDYGDPLHADKGGSKRGPRPNGVEDFWKKVDKSGECWVWTAGKDPDGYGIFSVKDKPYRAHRYLAKTILGWEVGDLQVCHTCDNPSCVNPDHLFLGTPLQNTRDAVSKGRMTKGEKSHLARLTEKQVKYILQELEKGTPRRKLREALKVSKSAVAFVAQGRTWKHITRSPELAQEE